MNSKILSNYLDFLKQALGLPYAQHSSLNAHKGNIIWTEQSMFRKMKEKREGYMIHFEKRGG